MSAPSIYEFVKAKLITHGVEGSKDGLLTLDDPKLFSSFVNQERARRACRFSAVQSATLGIEEHLVAIRKRHLLIFAYMYLRFSDLTPKQHGPDEQLDNGGVRKSMVFSRDVTDEERLIGLWAKVQYDQVGEAMLRLVYADK